ncbi:MAG TPA: hypothetical protein VM513_20165 [Kofleriaceae bacterium]|jgi:hypothetical protein|nr:hypothetical protein [Kofleriaceae bacterium]
MSEKDVDEAIEHYRTQLLAEAELGARELDEIEDHLRTLIEDLRATGMPATVAVTEAARRVGDPRAVAREHARVRGAFGAKLSRLRAWSVAALMLPMLTMLAISGVGYEGVWSRSGLELGFGLVLFTALVARLSWARPVLLGGLAFYIAPSILAAWMWPAYNAIWLLVPIIGAVAFLAPWRRGELTAAGAALALQVWAYAAASYALNYQYTSGEGSPYVPVAPTAQVALVAAVVATIGGLLRARWSAIAALGSSLTLALAVIELSSLRFVFSDPEVMRASLLTIVASGAITSALASILAWRSARSLLGTLREIAR